MKNQTFPWGNMAKKRRKHDPGGGQWSPALRRHLKGNRRCIWVKSWPGLCRKKSSFILGWANNCRAHHIWDSCTHHSEYIGCSPGYHTWNLLFGDGYHLLILQQEEVSVFWVYTVSTEMSSVGLPSFRWLKTAIRLFKKRLNPWHQEQRMLEEEHLCECTCVVLKRVSSRYTSEPRERWNSMLHLQKIFHPASRHPSPHQASRFNSWFLGFLYMDYRCCISSWLHLGQTNKSEHFYLPWEYQLVF